MALLGTVTLLLLFGSVTLLLFPVVLIWYCCFSSVTLVLLLGWRYLVLLLCYCYSVVLLWYCYSIVLLRCCYFNGVT